MNSFQNYIDNLIVQFKQPLLGADVQFEMAHVKRDKTNYKDLPKSNYRESAVLIFIYPENNKPTFVLIQRPSYNGYHSAQIALPGGKTEPHDIDLEATAIREFKEETGCVTTPVIIGKCTPLYIPVSNFIVHPFVGYLLEKPTFNHDTREVEQLIYCSIETLLNPSIIKETVVNPAPNLQLKTPYFDIENKIVWGATAMILNEFKEMVKLSIR